MQTFTTTETNKQPLELLQDRATALDEDAFEHRAYADVLADVVLTTRHSLTVGLFGPWGMGKSSVLKRLAKRVEADAAFVEFDAWRYDADGFRREFLREITTQLAGRHFLDNYDAQSRLAQLDQDRQRGSRRLELRWAYIVPALMTAAAVALLVFGALQLHAVRSGFNAAKGTPALLSVVAGLVTLIAKALSDILYLAPESVTTRRLEDPDRFRAAFDELIAKLKPPRLVIAVDNLDRCSPDRAVELLATVKTYLEPAAAAAHQRTVVFVIAVDDQALRRHLGAGDVHADEYLRKIFAATVRIAPLVPYDLRSYIRRLVEHQTPALALQREEQQPLTGLLHAALRTNPRRVIQFLNNLLLRYRLLDDRTSGGTEPSVSRRLAVAKLALLEEEWPQAYAALEAQPHLLAEWQRAVTAEGTPPESLEHLDESEWARLADFLRYSHDVAVPDVRGLIRLKRIPAQSNVPDYDAFREAATSGARDDAADIVSEHPGAIEAYVNELAEIFEEERQANWTAAARSVLDLVLWVPELRAVTAPCVRMVGAALNDPDIAPTMTLLPLEPLAVVGTHLPEPQQYMVVDVLLRALSGEDPNQARTAAQVIARRSLPVTDRQRHQLKNVVTQPPLLDPARWPAQAALLDADPALCSNPVVDGIVNQLNQKPELWTIDCTGEAAVDVMGVGVRRLAAPDMGDRVLESIPEHTLIPDESRAAVLGRIRSVVEAAAPSASGRGRSAAARKLLPWLQIQSAEQRSAAADWIWSVVANGVEDVDYVIPFAQVLLSEPTAGIAWLERHAGTIPARSAPQLADVLMRSTFPPGDAEAQERAMRALDPPGAVDRMAERIVVLLSGESPPSPKEVGERLAELPERLGNSAAEDLAHAIVRAADQALERGEPPWDWLELLTAQEPIPAAVATSPIKLLERAANKAWTAAEAARALNIAIDLAGAGRGDDAIERVANTLVTHQNGEWNDSEHLLSLVHLVIENAARVGSGIRRHVGVLLLNQIVHGGRRRADALAALERLPLTDKSDRDVLVATALDMEGAPQLLQDQESRVALLRVAHFANPQDQRVEARLDELSQSPRPEERAVLVRWREASQAD